MTVLQKFMFDRSFDAPSAESVRRKREAEEAAKRAEEKAQQAEEGDAPAEPEEPPAPTFSEDDIAAARAQGFLDGKQAGNQEAWTQFRTQTDQMAVKGLKVIGDNMQALVGDMQAANKMAYRDAVAVAVAVVQKLFPTLSDRGAADEVETVVVDCLRRLQPEPKVVVQVNGYIAEALQDRLEPLIEELGFEGQLVLEIDDDLAQTDCRVKWAGGGAQRNGEAMWVAINTAIREHLDIDPVALEASEPAGAHAHVDADPGDLQAVADEPEPAAVEATIARATTTGSDGDVAPELLGEIGFAVETAGSADGDSRLESRDGPTGAVEALDDDLELAKAT